MARRLGPKPLPGPVEECSGCHETKPIAACESRDWDQGRRAFGRVFRLCYRCLTRLAAKTAGGKRRPGWGWE